MEKLLYQILLFIITSSTLFGYAQTAPGVHPRSARRITADFALDTVLRLPEIREDDTYIRRVTKGKRHLLSMLYGEPDHGHPYYWVVVGEDNGMSFVTHYTFYIYTNGRKILYHDNFSDSTIDLKAWQQRMHRKR